MAEAVAKSYGAVDQQSNGEAKRASTEVVPFSGRHFPTMWVDIVAATPFILLAIVQRRQKGPILPLTFEKRAYLEEMWSNEILFDGPNKAVFVFYIFDVVLTLVVVAYHMCWARHPKYYVTLGNKISITAHIIGGTCGILGLFAGLYTGLPELVVAAIVLASILHLPTVLWQLRSLHGHREVIIPAYLFIVIGLAKCYANALTLNLRARDVVKCGMCLHIFSWCRLLMWWGEAVGMDPEQTYDRMVILAGVAHLSFVADHYGGLMMVVFIYWWNTVFSILKPFPRELLAVNRGFHDTFPDSYTDPDGKIFSELYEEYQQQGMEKLDAIQHAAYDMLRSGDEEVSVEDLARLIESWGIPQSDQVARDLFHKADENTDGKVSFEEFSSNLWFVWQSIRDKGEMDTRAQKEKRAIQKREQHTIV